MTEGLDKKPKIYLGLLSAVLLLDVAFSVLLVPTSGALWDLASFSTSFAEWVVLSCVRVPLLLALLVLGVKRGRRPPAPRPMTQFDEFSDDRERGGESSSLLLEEFGDEPGVPLEERGEAESDAHKKRRKYWRNAALALTFVLLTASQVTLGVQAVTFQFSEDRLKGPMVLLCFVVLFINAELFLTRKATMLMTRDEGVLLPLLHNHELFLVDVDYKRCDKCGERVSEKQCYSCDPCNFDVCADCFRKAQYKAAENTARSDSRGTSGEQMISTRDYVAKSWQLLRPHWPLVVAALLLILGARACTVLSPRYQGSILDTIVQYDGSDMSAFFAVLRGYVLVSVASGLLGGASALCFALVDKRLRRDLRALLFARFLHQDIVFFDSANTGDLQQRLMRDVSTMLAPVSYAARGMLGNVVQLIGAFVLAVTTSWRLSVLAFTVLGPLTMLTTAYAEWSREIYYGMWSDQGEMAKVSKEALGNIRTVRAMSAEPLEERNFQRANLQSYRKSIKASVVGAGNSMLSSYMELGVGVLILGFGGTVVMRHGQLTVGSLITFQLYWNMLSSSFQAIVDSLSSFTSAGGAATRIFGLLHSLPDIDIHAGIPLERSEVRGGILFDQVDFTYQSRPDTPVLKGLQLRIEPCSTVAIVGASGGGKSTILQLLLRFYDPTRGSVMLDGRDLRSLRAHDLRRLVGYVSQDTELWNSSVLANVTYGLEEHEWTMEQVERACKDAHAYDFVMALESQWEEKVGEKGVRLSGGQKQRLAIARCLLRKPKLLLLDEATSALDAESEAQVQVAIDALMGRRECTMVIVAHRLSTVRGADCILVLSEGALVEQGTHQELLAAEGQYATLVRKQLETTVEVGEEEDKQTQNAQSRDGIPLLQRVESP